jgi:hypothetical protein
LDKPETMFSAYALLNRIRLSASDAVLAEAENVVKRVAEQYCSPDMSPEEMRAVTRTWEGDPLRAFGEACRAELKAIRVTVQLKARISAVCSASECAPLPR